MTTEETKKRLLKKPELNRGPDWSKGLSTGSTLLNLACSGRPNVGYVGGRYFFFVGDSSSGKTFITMTCFSEACKNPEFKNHRLIFDNVEGGADMDWVKMFGASAASKIEPPQGTREKPRNSQHLEGMYYNVNRAIDAGRPFIYVVDSETSLVPKAHFKRFKDDQEADEKGKDAAGSFNTERARINSNNLAIIWNKLKKDGRSILILISQTRQNIGYGAMFNPKTRAGGLALTFYAGLEMWTSQKGHIKTKYRGKDREQGIYSQIRIRKNRLCGRDRSIILPILHSTGIDETGSMIDYCIEEDHWKIKGGKIIAPEFGEESMKREDLIRHIEETNGEGKLKTIVAVTFNDIEKAISAVRKPRYE